MLSNEEKIAVRLLIFSFILIIIGVLIATLTDFALIGAIITIVGVVIGAIISFLYSKF